MRDVRAEKSTTATDTVTKLLVKLSPNRIINMGTMSERPPVMATMKRASMSTNGESLLGRFAKMIFYGLKLGASYTLRGIFWKRFTPPNKLQAGNLGLGVL